MKQISMRDRVTMRMMDYTIRAWYKNAHGVPFYKDFTAEKDLQEFNREAEAVGTTMTDCTRI